MSAPGSAPPGWRCRRVVLALDASTGDAATLERVAALAAALSGELTALLVEDSDLARLAQHRDVPTFGLLSSTGRVLPAEDLGDALRLRAARLRRELEAAAARRRVKVEMQVRRGRLPAEVLAAAGDGDLVVVGWPAGSGAAPWGSPPPAAVVHALAEAARHSVLLLHPAPPAGGAVLVAWDGGDAARSGLAAALRVAELDGVPIRVVLLEGRLQDAERSAAEVAAALGEGRVPYDLVHAPKAGLETLAQLAGRSRCALLVLPAARALAEADTGRRLLQRAPCSVLLMR